MVSTCKGLDVGACLVWLLEVGRAGHNVGEANQKRVFELYSLVLYLDRPRCLSASVGIVMHLTGCTV